jgi:hypothetical protein
MKIDAGVTCGLAVCAEEINIEPLDLSAAHGPVVPQSSEVSAGSAVLATDRATAAKDAYHRNDVQASVLAHMKPAIERHGG